MWDAYHNYWGWGWDSFLYRLEQQATQEWEFKLKLAMDAVVWPKKIFPPWSRFKSICFRPILQFRWSRRRWRSKT